jgi:hypothetical protein
VSLEAVHPSALEHMHSPVLVNFDFMELGGFRSAEGRRLVIRWGQPNEQGHFDPVFEAVDDNKVLVDRDVLAELERRALGL